MSECPNFGWSIHWSFIALWSIKSLLWSRDAMVYFETKKQSSRRTDLAGIVWCLGPNCCHYITQISGHAARQVQYLGESHAVLTSVPGTVATRVQTVFSFKRPSLVVTQFPVWEHVLLLVGLWTHGLVVRSGWILCFVQFQGVHHVLEGQFPFDGVSLLVRVADSSWLGFYAASPRISPLVVFWRVGWSVSCWTFSYMKQNIELKVEYSSYMLNI